jgi:hypothetical protein
MVGQMLDSQVTKVHIIVQLEVMSHLEEQLLMLIINVAFMLELTSLEQMLRSCQDNGNFKLGLA